MTNSNRITWPPLTIIQCAALGFKPFVGYWVRLGDDKLYTLDEVLAAEYPLNERVI